MKGILIWTPIRLIVWALLFLGFCSGCASFHLDTIKYKVGGGYGKNNSINGGSWTDHYKCYDGKEWNINGAIELTYKRHRDEAKAPNPRR